MRNLILFCLVFSYGLSLFSQSILENSYNMFRPGDKLIKQQIEFKDPGEPGTNQFWNFSNQKSINDHYILSYDSQNNDSLIIGSEHRTLYKYILSGDSLFSSGYENSTTLMNYLKPELLLIFPSSYQRSYQDYFYGKGEYCGQLDLTVMGRTLTTIDAYGAMILPSGDTLANVLRVHHEKRMTERTEILNHDLDSTTYSIASLDSIDHHLNSDSMLIKTDTYRWYSDGYRYPVFETIQNTIYNHGVPVGISNTAFYYTPEEQYYGLRNDPDNIEKQERMKLDKEKRNNDKSNKKNKQNDLEDNIPSVNYNLTFADGNNSLIVDYHLLEDAETGIMLFDMAGKLLEKYPKSRQKAGNYQRTFSLEGYQRGEYLLRIMVGDKVIGEKITKN